MSKLNSDKFVQLLRKLTIKKRMIFSFFIICFFPIILAVSIYFVSTYIEQNEKYSEYAKNYSYQANLRIDNLFDQVIKKVEQISTNSDILADIYLYENSTDHKNEYVKKRIEIAIDNIINNQDGIEFATIYTESKEVFSYGTNYFNENFNYKIRENKNIYLDTIQTENKDYILVSKKIKLRYDKDDKVYLVIAMNIEYLNKLCREISSSKEHEIIITDEYNNVLVNKDKNELFKSTRINNNNDFTIINKIPNTNLNIINTFKPNKLWIKSLLTNLIVAVILIFIFSIFILYLANQSIVNPLNKLLNNMKSIEENNIMDFKLKEEKCYNDEQAILDEAFGDMIERLKILVDDVYNSKIKEKELEFLIKELELNALQQQINPHFLYNVLESIFWIADMNGHEQISEMISELGSFFKTSISGKDEFIPISVEIENVKSYINLQKIMCDNNFEVKWVIDDEILNYKTVKLILQPIIENSIIHGLYNKDKDGLITIKCNKYNNTIIFDICDNGCGIKEETLQEITYYINSKDDDVKKSVGLKNVNKRIKLYFGDDYGISILSKVNEGTCMKIVIPIKG